MSRKLASLGAPCGRKTQTVLSKQETFLIETFIDCIIKKKRKMLFRPTVAMTLLSVAAGAKIAMKPFEDPSMLSQISGIYFEPIVSTDNYCDESSIPRNCGGKIDLDLSADSNIEFEWIASESMDKYISVSSPTGTIQFGKYHISLLHLSI